MARREYSHHLWILRSPEPLDPFLLHQISATKAISQYQPLTRNGDLLISIYIVHKTKISREPKFIDTERRRLMTSKSHLNNISWEDRSTRPKVSGNISNKADNIDLADRQESKSEGSQDRQRMILTCQFYVSPGNFQTVYETDCRSAGCTGYIATHL